MGHLCPLELRLQLFIFFLDKLFVVQGLSIGCLEQVVALYLVFPDLNRQLLQLGVYFVKVCLVLFLRPRHCHRSIFFSINIVPRLVAIYLLLHIL